MKIEGYKNVALLGEGPLGKVFKANKITESKPVRLKVVTIDEALDTERLRNLIRSFFSRVSSLRKQRIPHLLTPIDAGRTDLYFYCVYPWFDHNPLIRYLSDRPREIEDYHLLLMRSLLQTIKVLHSQELIHGNIKLSNTFIQERQDGFIPILSDAAMTPIYLALEKLHGDAFFDQRYVSAERMRGNEPTASDDLFSLSVLFYRIIVGRYPFAECDPALLEAGQFQRPSTIRPELGAPVDTFFTYLFSPGWRPQTPDDLARIIDEYERAESVPHQGIGIDMENKSSQTEETINEEDIEQLLVAAKQASHNKSKRVILIVPLVALALIVAAYFLIPGMQQRISDVFTSPSRTPVTGQKRVSVKPTISPTSKPVINRKPITTLAKKVSITTEPVSVNIFSQGTYIGSSPFELEINKIASPELTFFAHGFLSKKITVSSSNIRDGHLKVALVKNPLPYQIRSDSDWVMDGRDSSNTHSTNAPLKLPLQQKWMVALKSETESSPMVKGDRIFCATTNGRVHVIDVNSGALVDRIEFPMGTRTSPSVLKDHLLIAGKDGKIRLFGLKGYKERAAFSARTYILGAPLVVKNRAYIVTATGTVLGFKLTPKRFHRIKIEEQWSVNIGERIIAEPAWYHHKVYLASATNLYAVNEKDGSTEWSYFSSQSSEKANTPPSDTTIRVVSDADESGAAPCVCGKTLVFSAKSGWIHGLNPDTGSVLWKNKLGDSKPVSPACWKGLILLAADDGRITAFDAVNGNLIYTRSMGNAIIAAPIISDGRLVIVTLNGTIHVLDVFTGKSLSQTVVDGTVIAHPVLSNGTLFVINRDGELTAFN